MYQIPAYTTPTNLYMYKISSCTVHTCNIYATIDTDTLITSVTLLFSTVSMQGYKQMLHNSKKWLYVSPQSNKIN